MGLSQSNNKTKKSRYLIFLCWQYWVSLVRHCGWGPGRHVVQWGFERHHSQTQLNSSQPKFRPLISSKHLWCPKNILEETGLQRNKPFWIPLLPFPAPKPPSLSLVDTSLSFIAPSHSQLCFCALYWISVGALFPCSKETITAASRPLYQHSDTKRARSNCVCVDAYCAAWSKVWPDPT